MIRGPLSRPREDFGMVALLINGFATLLWERRSKVTCRESASFFFWCQQETCYECRVEEPNGRGYHDAQPAQGRHPQSSSSAVDYVSGGKVYTFNCSKDRGMNGEMDEAAPRERVTTTVFKVTFSIV